MKRLPTIFVLPMFIIVLALIVSCSKNTIEMPEQALQFNIQDLSIKNVALNQGDAESATSILLSLIRGHSPRIIAKSIRDEELHPLGHIQYTSLINPNSIEGETDTNFMVCGSELINDECGHYLIDLLQAFIQDFGITEGSLTRTIMLAADKGYTGMQIYSAVTLSQQLLEDGTIQRCVQFDPIGNVCLTFEETPPDSHSYEMFSDQPATAGVMATAIDWLASLFKVSSAEAISLSNVLKLIEGDVISLSYALKHEWISAYQAWEQGLTSAGWLIRNHWISAVHAKNDRMITIREAIKKYGVSVEYAYSHHWISGVDAVENYGYNAYTALEKNWISNEEAATYWFKTKEKEGVQLVKEGYVSTEEAFHNNWITVEQAVKELGMTLDDAVTRLGQDVDDIVSKKLYSIEDCVNNFARCISWNQIETGIEVWFKFLMAKVVDCVEYKITNVCLQPTSPIFSEIPVDYAPNQAYADWMGRYRKTLGILNLNELTIPGSHDSGTYTIGQSIGDHLETLLPYLIALSPLQSPFIALGGSEEQWRNYVKYGQAEWARTQQHTIYAQLEGGLRFFDIRVKMDNNTWKIEHTYLGGKLTDILTDINDFLQTYPDEIIFVNLKATSETGNEPSESQKEDLFTLFQDALGDKLLDVSLFPKLFEASLEAVWSYTGRVIVLAETNAKAANNTTFAKGSDFIVGTWSSSVAEITGEELINWHNKRLIGEKNKEGDKTVYAGISFTPSEPPQKSETVMKGFATWIAKGVFDSLANCTDDSFVFPANCLGGPKQAVDDLFNDPSNMMTLRAIAQTNTPLVNNYISSLSVAKSSGTIFSTDYILEFAPDFASEFVKLNLKRAQTIQNLNN